MTRKIKQSTIYLSQHTFQIPSFQRVPVYKYKDSLVMAFSSNSISVSRLLMIGKLD